MNELNTPWPWYNAKAERVKLLSLPTHPPSFRLNWREEDKADLGLKTNPLTVGNFYTLFAQLPDTVLISCDIIGKKVSIDKRHVELI